MPKIQITMSLEQKRALEQYKLKAEKKLKKRLTMSKLLMGMLISFMEMSPIRED
jgi:hypothetical protein